MSFHSILSPSSSQRWLNCPPSVRLCETLPDIIKPAGSFDYAAQGTAAHALGEAKLRLAFKQITQEEYDAEYEEIKKGQYYDDELEHYVDSYVNFVRSQVGSEDDVYIETRVDYSDYVPEGTGSADCIIMGPTTCHVLDYKHGMVPVSAISNSQARLYAVGAISKFEEKYPNIKNIKYTIVQPRADNISSEETTKDKLILWADTVVRKKAKQAWVGGGEFQAGEHCKYCKAKATCKTRQEQVTEIARLEFREPALLDDDEVSLVLSKAQDLRTWVNDVEEYLLSRAINQNVVPIGFKLTTSVTHRKISDHGMAAAVLVDKGMDPSAIWEQPKLKSIATLEKIGPSGQVTAWLGDLVIRPEGQPKLVREKVKGKEDFV
jgi:hypothetical protein